MLDITRAEREARKALFAEGLKRCSKCLEALPIDRFQPNARGWMGLHSQCRGCKNESGAEYRRNNPEQERDRVQRYRGLYDIGQRLNSGAVRARKLGCSVEKLTSEDVRVHWAAKGWVETSCSYCMDDIAPGDLHVDHQVPLCQGRRPHARQHPSGL
ncbi:hypothetical protein RE9414_35360 [Prescottella equi]|nr:hypothetical protein RE9414_35360 [Prescottella equi]